MPNYDFRRTATFHREGERWVKETYYALSDALARFRAQFSAEYPETQWADMDLRLFVDPSYMANAIDSMVLRDRLEPGFPGQIRISYSIDSDLRLEVEDNGMGVNPDLEELLHKVPILSAKSDVKTQGIIWGAKGSHLYRSAKIISGLGGNTGFKNKGHKKGAIFWYEVPARQVIIQH